MHFTTQFKGHSLYTSCLDLDQFSWDRKANMYVSNDGNVSINTSDRIWQYRFCNIYWLHKKREWTGEKVWDWAQKFLQAFLSFSLSNKWSRSGNMEVFPPDTQCAPRSQPYLERDAGLMTQGEKTPNGLMTWGQIKTKLSPCHIKAGLTCCDRWPASLYHFQTQGNLIRDGQLMSPTQALVSQLVKPVHGLFSQDCWKPDLCFVAQTKRWMSKGYITCLAPTKDISKDTKKTI